MKKFIKSLTLLSLLMAVLYIPLLLLWGDVTPYWLYTNLKYKKGHGSTELRLNEARNVSNPDILILGSSHAYRGFDIRLFRAAGYSTFNLGSSAQTPMQTYILLQRYLKSIQPKFVIYEVYPETFTSLGIESGTDIISNDINDTLSLTMALKTNNLITYNTLLYGYYHDATRKKQENPADDLPDEDTYIPGGYVEQTVKHYRNVAATEKRKLYFEPEQREAFKNNIALLKKYNIKYVLVFAPVTKGSYNSYTNMADFERYMRSNGPYYDYNKKVSLNDSLHFFDYGHLNQRGVEIFNRELLKNREIFSPGLKEKSGL